MDARRPSLEDAYYEAVMSGMGIVALGEIADDLHGLKAELVSLHPIKAATAFAGLLTKPELQSNCARLEALVHLSLALCAGRRAPSQQFMRRAFARLGRGACGLIEDPAEDVFVSSVVTPRGNFRTLEGIWESGGFYLQRMIDIIEAMPVSNGYAKLRDQVYALLGLSDLICHRAGLVRFELGNPVPLRAIPKSLGNTKAAGDILRFREDDLRGAGIEPEDLMPFLFDPEDCESLLTQDIGQSALGRRPLAADEGDIYVVLPTAISVAIRLFVVEQLTAAGMRSALCWGIAKDYAALFSRCPLLGGPSGAPLAFQPTEHGILAGVSFPVDRGRWMNLALVLDTLEAFAETGLGRPHAAPDDLAQDFDRLIGDAYESATAESKDDFRGGITIIVGCGIGRGVAYKLPMRDRPGWRVEFMSAADFYALCYAPRFKPLSLWRTLQAVDRVSEAGVELQNLNGLINLVAWSISLEGHVVPHGELPDDFISDDHASIVVIEQNGLRKLRAAVAQAHDVHAELTIDGEWKRVTRDSSSYLFDEERTRPVYAYADVTRASDGPLGLYVSPQRAWWSDVRVPTGTSGPKTYQRWMIVQTWLPRAVPILEERLYGLPQGPLLWKTIFENGGGDFEKGEAGGDFKEARGSISATADPERGVIEIRVGEAFDRATFNVDNDAERALIDALVEGAALLRGQALSADARAEIVDAIVQGKQARHAHAFRVTSFRERVQESVAERPILIAGADDAYHRIGLGWSVRDRSAGAVIEGKPDCIGYLNRLLASLEDQLCDALHSYDRRSLIEMSLRNHEAAIRDRDHWHRTASAVLALQDDKQAALRMMAEHDFRLNAVFQATRMLVEFAICECPLEGGAKPGELDLARLMALSALVFGIGGWSDAVRWNVMEPKLRVTPLGDVHANFEFVENIIEPYSRAFNDARISDAVDSYAKHLEEPTFADSIHEHFDPKFLLAWGEESGASIDDFRLFLDYIENLAYLAGQAVLEIPRSKLLAVATDGRTLPTEISTAIVDFLTFHPRQRWREAPPGFEPRDLHPWRFRRRLSLLRRPLVQFDDTEEDPTLLLVPGLVRDAFTYMVTNYQRGDYPQYQLGPRMKVWQGAIANARGRTFNADVAARLEQLGWRTDTEVKLTKLLRKGFDRDYGDIDVLAWHPDTGRVLAIECKDVQYRKTEGEIAEQLSDFRGEVDEKGDRDYLRKHLDRMDIVSAHLPLVGKYVGQSTVAEVESHLVFRNPVPMQYALEHMQRQVSVSVFERLNEL